MVYCKLISHNKDVAIYRIGSVISDITGVMHLDYKKHEYIIVEKPKREPVYEHFIDKLILKYQKEFDEGRIPESMSYEI